MNRDSWSDFTISYLIAGFLGKKQYATIADNILVIKLEKLLCLECSIWHMFFNSSFTVSITDLFLSNILSCNSISVFFILFLIPVIKWMPSINNSSTKFLSIYPLSAYNLWRIFSTNFLSFKGCLSSTFPGVITKLRISPLSL